ncbi:transporter substrate-binding domain-containing protein [Azoarcus olearius]|uniref:Glutamine-binding protein n=1 Tax=Azoarcus sp. (strain BH72) TaxID=418699 RepID=A1K2K4_AZOSB|nr:transporter substrate-binding domain-containing protein [Azoarcus olearius]CAL93059.1 putative glutamine-binding protein [Azoarcus olearius]
MRTSLSVLALCFAAAGLAAPAHAAEPTGTLKKIKDSGTITVGHRESSVPFSYLDADQKPVGYAMDLCAKVVDAVKDELKLPKLEVKYQAVTSQNRIPLMQNGTIDIECGSTTNSVQRQQQVGFSVNYFVTSVRMAVRKDSGIKDIGDLNGKPVATTTGTTSDALIKQNEKGKSIDVRNIYGKDHADSFLMVESGRAAAFVMDDILLAGLIASSKNPAAYEIVGPSLRDEPYGVMLRKDDTEFKAVVDKALTGLMKSGEAEKMYTKWFTQPIPPRNVNLNFPMSAATKAALTNPTDKGVE